MTHKLKDIIYESVLVIGPTFPFNWFIGEEQTILVICISGLRQSRSLLCCCLAQIVLLYWFAMNTCANIGIFTMNNVIYEMFS